MSERVFLGLGANLGDRTANLRMALRFLPPPAIVVAVSSLYESPAHVPEGAPAGPDYANAACEIATALMPEAMLVHIREIEHAIGRRVAARWAPRPIDIDILLFGDRVIDMEALRVPHPRMCDRAFVLLPLAEIAGDVVHPERRETIARLASRVDHAGTALIARPGWQTHGPGALD